MTKKLNMKKTHAYIESKPHGKTARLAIVAIRHAVRNANPADTMNAIYENAWSAAKAYQSYAFKKQLPRIINAHTAKGKAIITRASNTIRARDGALHERIVRGLLGVVSNLDVRNAPRSNGDFTFDGELCEAKTTLRERRKQIFADGNAPSYVFVQSVESSTAASYITSHGAKLVVCSQAGYEAACADPHVLNLSDVIGTQLYQRLV